MENPMPAIPNPVQVATANYPVQAKACFDTIRDMIFDEAQRLDAGPLEETLKWGEPSYLTSKTKSGSTIRMAWKANDPENCNIYLNCNTDLVDRFRSEFPTAFKTTGNRCIHIPLDKDVPELPLRAALAMALTYHRDRKAR
jgi:hypothetical protein